MAKQMVAETRETLNALTERASAKVLSLVAAGAGPEKALREVCGASAVDAMIDELYRELRAK